MSGEGGIGSRLPVVATGPAQPMQSADVRITQGKVFGRPSQFAVNRCGTNDSIPRDLGAAATSKLNQSL